ncbi:PREDICTED: feruloyl CoA ortho-hydroxylase 2 [Tarenaya hassleriana]|uniref:feruloyl CoA ortho-hydroxylase 2 n=1 Tax=Tarenaya hassleriana TaxID=28532 RepID=UPI00053C608E|nr:PREDICTED: feruloyl CoA ortho-hydroxylase 2 [Tarenaya hassleriana]
MADRNGAVDVTEFVVNQRNGVKGLVDVVSPKSLPPQYVQPPEELLSAGNILAPGSSPVNVIDVSDWTDPRVAEEICEAASTRGFFQIVGHGIPAEELHALRAAARGFFGLAAEERKRYWRGDSVSETMWMTTSFNPYEEQVLEWRDFVKFEYPETEDSAATWPSVCKEQVIEHFKRIRPIAKKMLSILMIKLNSNMDDDQERTLMGTLRMNFNYYPECPNPELAAGVGRHSDINTLTILLQDDVVGGLYARATEHGDKWIQVPPVEDALLVNIGDVLQILSNDRYRSVEHRVTPNRVSRVSIPVFCGPVNDSVIEPLREALEKGEMPRYKKIVYSDYLKSFFGKPHDGKRTMESIRIVS